jgi:hypothetical protein
MAWKWMNRRPETGKPLPPGSVSFFVCGSLAFRGKQITYCLLRKADVAELADALDSKSSSRK